MKVKILSVLVLILMFFSSIGMASNLTKTQNFVELKLSNDYPQVSITVDYIEQIDDLDVGSKPDFYYVLKVYKSYCYFLDPQVNESDVYDEPDSTDPNVWQVDKTHSFNAYDDKIAIDIELKEDDTIDIPPNPDDYADISGKKGDGPSDPYGKKFTIVYDMNTNEILPRYTGESWDDDTDGYIILNGEKDGRGKMGPGEEDSKEDDAKMRIKITDTYEPMTGSFKIQNTEIFEGDNKPNIIPGKTVIFECNIQGGLPPFEYCFYPMGQTHGSEYYQETVDSRQFTITFEYDKNNKYHHGLCAPLIGLFDSYDLAKEDQEREYVVLTADEVIINQRPIANKPYEKRVLTFWEYWADNSEDPDGDSLEYSFDINNGQETTQWSRNYIYTSSKKLNSIKVKVRDDPSARTEITFSDGLTSTWSEPLPKTKSISIFNLYMKKLSNIFEFFQNFYF